MDRLAVLRYLDENMTPRNWTQRRIHDGKGRYCLVGHIARYNGLTDQQFDILLPPELSELHSDTCRQMERALGVPSLPRLNDDAKSFDELMGHIREAIENEEAKVEFRELVCA